MYTIEAVNVNDAYLAGRDLLEAHGVLRDSRVGRVLEVPGPVATTYSRPWERVLFCPNRDANPFFHFMEAMWMLAGRNDIQWPVTFNSRFKQYSDDGITQHGAYGRRWRHHFGIDQIQHIVNTLQDNPDDRRCVLQMWDPRVDTTYKGVDAPCNTSAYFKIDTDGRLRMTVSCRSNDIIWGLYGANAVHFSFLQEYIAALVPVPIGSYTHISDSFHGYVDILEKHDDPQHLQYPITPIEGSFYLDIQRWDCPVGPLEHFIEEPAKGQPEWYLDEVARPMYLAWISHKRGDRDRALNHALSIYAEDWRFACVKWLERRYA